MTSMSNEASVNPLNDARFSAPMATLEPNSPHHDDPTRMAFGIIALIWVVLLLACLAL